MAFFKEISNVGLLRSKFFPKWNPEVEKAFFKLTNNQISPDGCLIAESDDLGSLFEWGHEAAEKGLKIVEFSFPRSSKPWGYLALTGEKDALDSINLKNCDLITRLECTTSLQDYF
jgi:hypothetical protein